MPTPSRTATPPRTTRTPAENCTVADARARGIRRYADLRRSAGRDSPRRRAPRLPRARNAQPRRSALSRMPGREPSAITQISATVRPGCPPHCAPRLPPPRTRATAEICTIADARARGIRNCADLRHTAAPMTHPHRARHPPLRRSPHQPGCPTPPQAQLRTSALSRMPGRQTSAIEQISATVQPGCPPRAATPPCTTRATADIYTVADARARGIRNYADLRSSAAQAPRPAAPGAGSAAHETRRNARTPHPNDRSGAEFVTFCGGRATDQATHPRALTDPARRACWRRRSGSSRRARAARRRPRRRRPSRAGATGWPTRAATR